MKFSIVWSLICAVSIFTACDFSFAETQRSAIRQISVEEAKQAMDGKNAQFVDVRTEAEYASGRAPRTVNLPLDSLEENMARLDRSKPIYVICQTGRRSQKAAELLEKNGFKDLYNVEGGTTAWEKAGLPVEK